MGKKKVKYNYKKEVCEEIFFKILYDDTGYFKEWEVARIYIYQSLEIE